MLSRLSYTFREMWASLRRNLTLTVAAVITSTVSLLLFGSTLLIQHGFDNQLSKWTGGVEMIVYVKNDAAPEQRGRQDPPRRSRTRPAIIEDVTYCDVAMLAGRGADACSPATPTR